MEELFHIQGSIPVMRDSVPIRFVHHKNLDRPESHVLHINNYLELYVYVQGNHKYIVENRLYELRRGDIILINPREVHKALPLEPCLYERFYLLLDADCFRGLSYDPLSYILGQLPRVGNLISPPEEAREQVLQLLYAISGCVARSQVQALGLVLQLLAVCAGQMQGANREPGPIAPVPELLEQILSYVARNTASLQSTQQIAQALGLTPQYLSTYFRRHIGTPLKIYIQAKKIALAKDLLDKGADVTGACFDSGFNDCSYFIRVFKKYVGVTPLNYRRSLRK